MGAMLQQSTFHMDFPYVMFVMERCVTENIQPNEAFITRLEKFHNRCKKLSNDSSTNYGALFLNVFRLKLTNECFQEKIKNSLEDSKYSGCV